MTQGEQLIGRAIGWQPSRLNDSGKTVPGKLELAIDGESNAELAFFQNHMQFLSGKDGSSFLDKQVSIHAIYKSFYEPTNMRQFTPAGTLRVIGDQQAVAPTQPVRQVTQPTATQAPDGAAVGNSKTNSASFVTDHYIQKGKWPTYDEVIQWARLVNLGSQEMLSGRMTEATPDEPQERYRITDKGKAARVSPETHEVEASPLFDLFGDETRQPLASFDIDEGE